MWYVYVLRSSADGKHYIGMTSESPEERLRRHNAGRVKSTKGRQPFTLVYSERHQTAESARNREEFLKSGRGRSALRHLLGRVSGGTRQTTGGQARQ